MTKLEFALEFANQMEVLRRGHFADWEDLKRANRLLDAVREIDSCVRYFKTKADDKDRSGEPLNVQSKALVEAFDETPDPLLIEARELFDQLPESAQEKLLDTLRIFIQIKEEYVKCNK